jgi:hypothetical protein
LGIGAPPINPHSKTTIHLGDLAQGCRFQVDLRWNEEHSQDPPTSTNIHQRSISHHRASELLELLVSNPIKIGYSFDLKEKVDA